MPLQWGRDLPTAEMRQKKTDMDRVTRSPFNGAAIFRPRKYGLLSEEPCAGLSLQWGRDLPTAEIRPGYP